MADRNGMTLADLAAGMQEQPSPLARIGRGMTDLYQPAVSLFYGLFGGPGQQKQYDAQRQSDENLYLQGLLGGTGVPTQLRGAVPDLWRGVGQAAPFFAAGPLGGLRALTVPELANAAAWTMGGTAIGQPLTSIGDLWNYFHNGQ